jgi:hypothetical protein
MLLSSSKTKQKQHANNPTPRKVLKSSKAQTTRIKAVLSSSSSSSEEDNDDATVKTPPRRDVKASSKQLLLKICYPVPENQPTHLLHIQLLQNLTYNTTHTIVLLNKRFETLKTPAIIALQNQEVYVNHFDPKQEVRGYKKANNQITVIQPIQTTMLLSTIKRLPGIMEILTAGNAFINIHKWVQDEWDVSTIGFLTKFSPAHHPKHLATEYINNRTKQEPSMPQF